MLNLENSVINFAIHIAHKNTRFTHSFISTNEWQVFNTKFYPIWYCKWYPLEWLESIQDRGQCIHSTEQAQ